MTHVAIKLRSIDTVTIVDEILGQKAFEIEQKLCPEEVGLR